MINEHNYTEYLLLYIDNELDEQERLEVETFTQQNEVAATELRLLLQTKLPGDDNTGYRNKSELYKSGNRGIDINNYEEFFLSYTDNELTDEENEETERFVLQHPHLQQEFTSILATKLTADNIIYPNKESLYRKEQGRRVIPLFIRVFSVAATIIATVAIVWQFVPSRSILPSTTTEVVLNQNSKPTVSVPPLGEKSSSKNEISGSDSQQSAELVKEVLPKPKNTELKTVVNKAATTKHDPLIASTLPALHEPLAKILPPPIEDAQLQERVAARSASILVPLEEISNEDEESMQAAYLANNTPSKRQAEYRELDTENDEAHTLYVGSLQLNKAKVNGFLKSASHMLGSRIKPDADK